MLKICEEWPRDVTYFICLHRGGSDVSTWVPFSVCGGSMTIADDERSAVGRNLIVKACPPSRRISKIVPQASILTLRTYRICRPWKYIGSGDTSRYDQSVGIVMGVEAVKAS